MTSSYVYPSNFTFGLLILQLSQQNRYRKQHTHGSHEARKVIERVLLVTQKFKFQYEVVWGDKQNWRVGYSLLTTHYRTLLISYIYLSVDFCPSFQCRFSLVPVFLLLIIDL